MDDQQPSLKRRVVVNHRKKLALDDLSGPEPIRTCVTCGVPKTLDLYGKSKSNRLGRTRHCKECAVNTNMKAYWKDPDRYRKICSKNTIVRTAKRRAMVFAHYGKRCVCCGESGDRFLTVDHIQPIGSKNRDANGHRKMYDWLVMNKFPPGFQILCWNCNVGRYHNGGICPHQEGSQTIAQASSSKRSEAPDIPLRDDDMVESLPKGKADLSNTFHDNESWPFASDRVQ